MQVSDYTSKQAQKLGQHNCFIRITNLVIYLSCVSFAIAHFFMYRRYTVITCPGLLKRKRNISVAGRCVGTKEPKKIPVWLNWFRPYVCATSLPVRWLSRSSFKGVFLFHLRQFSWAGTHISQHNTQNLRVVSKH